MAEVFLSRRDIQKIVKTIGKRISKAIIKTQPEKPIVLLGVMDGAAMFMCDVAKEIEFPVVMLFAKCKSYTGTTRGNIEYEYWPDFDFTGRHVIIVDEIIDTGSTMRSVMEKILKKHEPACIEICGLIKRKNSPCYVDYLGRQVHEDAWLYGYGMDWPDKQNRNLANVYIK